MRKYSKLLTMTLCCAVIAASATGCGTNNTASDNKEVSSEATDKKQATDCLSYVTLGDYNEIELEKAEIDSAVETQIATNIKNTGKYSKETKGKVKAGDVLNIYYVGKIDGEAFEGGSCTKKSSPNGYDLEIGSNTFIDGFEDALIGKSIGKKHDINVTFPSSYSQNQDLAGKDAVFTVTINFKKIYPELSDKFVKNNFKDFNAEYKNTAADYKKYVRAVIVENKAWSKVQEASEIKDEYPEDKLKATKTQLKTSITSYLSQGGYELEDYLKAQNITSEDFDKQLESSAKEDVAQQLIYGAIAEKENINVTDTEYQKNLQTYIENYQCKDEAELNEKFEEQYGTKAEKIIKDDILFSNVRKFLVKNVKEI